MTALILGDKHDANRTRANQAVAGTGALRIVAEVLRTIAPSKRFWTPDPTWGNHHAIFGACGFGVNSYPYYDREKKHRQYRRLLRRAGKHGAGRHRPPARLLPQPERRRPHPGRLGQSRGNRRPSRLPAGR